MNLHNIPTQPADDTIAWLKACWPNYDYTRVSPSQITWKDLTNGQTGRYYIDTYTTACVTHWIRKGRPR